LKKKISILFLCFIMTIAMIPATVVNATVNAISVSYRTHVQDIGWQDFVSDGAMSGTSGQSKRLEGIEISVSGNSNLGIRYSTQIQDIGWQEFFADGVMSGTSGQSKRLEAIKIELTGSDAALYDVYYHVHAQDYGWLGWAKNGASSGTEGYSKRLEAIEICIVSAGAPSPGSTDNAFVKYVAPVAVSYKTHVQDYGWQGLVSNGATSGTSGESKRLEGICISLSGLPVSGGITYKTQVQDYGWMSWVSDGAMSGTSGQSKRLEAIQIKLTGDAANYYDVYYQVHAQNIGWMDWAKNGASSGTAGYSFRLEAINIILVAKGGAAPGATTKPFKQVQTPSFYTVMSSTTNTSIRTIGMYFVNKGTETVRIFSKDSCLIDNDFASFDRNTRLVQTSGSTVQYLDWIDIPAGKASYIYFMVDGTTTWYDKNSRMAYEFTYDTISYIGVSSSLEDYYILN